MTWKSKFIDNLECVKDMISTSLFLKLKEAETVEEVKELCLTEKNITTDWLYSTLPGQQFTAADYWDGDESVLM